MNIFFPFKSQKTFLEELSFIYAKVVLSCLHFHKIQSANKHLESIAVSELLLSQWHFQSSPPWVQPFFFFTMHFSGLPYSKTPTYFVVNTVKDVGINCPCNCLCVHLQVCDCVCVCISSSGTPSEMNITNQEQMRKNMLPDSTWKLTE